jgi:uncharacterized membrane protein YidH (DUF202 family)
MHFFLDFLSTKVAYAASERFDLFLKNVNSVIINPLIDLLFAVAVAYFLYGVFQFIMNQENEEAKTDGKSHMIWGVVGMVIMMGVWGILNLVLNTINVPTSQVNPEQGEVHLPDYNPTYPPR